MRDEFTQKTKDLLATRAGDRCSKPDCSIRTKGAASDSEGVINIGVAAHITAASSGGPRFDSSLTSEQRKSYSNGIWLCNNHGKLVDSDERIFTIEELERWKGLAAARSFQEVAASQPSPAGATLAGDEDVQTVADLLAESAIADLRAFQQGPGWPSHAIALNLELIQEEASDVFTAEGLASTIEIFNEIVVVAPPGTGKTTTLIQLVSAIIDNAAVIPVFIPLRELSTRSDTFFESILRRAAFRDCSVRQFETLADHGRLVLVLDGWNELDEVSRARVSSDIRTLLRDYPDIRLVISSRHNDLDIPVTGPRVEVNPLTEDQQLEIARSMRGEEGEIRLEEAWRTAGLGELVSIPLYLTALLEIAPGESLPTSKEQILRTFVRQLENNPDSRRTLRENLHGFHNEYLKDLAADATRRESVALSAVQARSTVSLTQECLLEAKQIAWPAEPVNVLETLINAHLLVSSGGEESAVSFQHQQFQEWYASFRVEELMLSATAGSDDADRKLREEVLDIRLWEEPTLFACERLSFADAKGASAVAYTIVETLGIDPLLSAAMIARVSEEVWEQVKADVISFVEKWHTAGRVDRAVHFMIDSGRPEFSEYVWPLVSSSDDQIHLHALRCGSRFRPRVLGSNIDIRIAELPEDVRRNVLSEFASNSGFDGMELAAKLARTDDSTAVKKAVINSLLFRRADRFAKEVLETAPGDVWQAVAKTWYSHEVNDPELATRLQEEANSLDEQASDPYARLYSLLNNRNPEPGAGTMVCAWIEAIDFSDRSQGQRWIVHQAYEQYPDDVVTALIHKLENGQDVPYQADEMLLASEVLLDEGPLVDAVLDESADRSAGKTAVGVIGPGTVGCLIDRIFALYPKIRPSSGTYDKASSDENHRLTRLVSQTKESPFVQAILERAGTEDPEQIAIMAELVARHGGSDDKEPFSIEEETLDRLIEIVAEWGQCLLKSSESTRAQFADVAQAAERLQAPSLVPILRELLSQDLVRRDQALQELVRARESGRRIDNDAHMRWTLQYQRAFAAIGDDRTVQIMKTLLVDKEFGVEAARVLREVWKKSQPEDKDSGFARWPDFSEVQEACAKRRNGEIQETHQFVDDILKVANGLIESGGDEADRKHAIKLAKIALSMPYANHAGTIESMLQLPLPTIDKQGLLTVLVLSGEVISSDQVMEGIDELLAEAKANPWILQEQHGWRLNWWLRLLPFTDDPNVILEVFDRLGERRVAPWHMRDLLSALRYSPSPEAENILGALAERDERFLNEYEWLAALAERNTVTAARIILDLVCSDSFADTRGSRDRIDYGRRIAALMSNQPEFRADVYERFKTLPEGPAKSVLDYAISEVADLEGILLLVHGAAASGKSFRTTGLYRAIEAVLVSRTPIGESGMQRLYGLPAPELRKELFRIVLEGSASESRIATECLVKIDEIRDDYGHIGAERRHPDIASGKSWPQL